MALNFPASPSNGQEYVAPNGVTYIYDAAAGLWYVKTSDAIGTSDIADSAITTAKLADDAVTGGKLANDITISTTGDLTANSLTLPTAPVVGYQQGLWTPTAPGLTSISTIADRCYWSRIGNHVTVWAFLSVLNSGSTSTSALYILGLPYLGTQNSGVGSVMGNNVGRQLHTVYLSAASEGVAFYENSSGSWAPLSPSNINTAGNNGQLYFNATFLTDDTTWTPQNGATVS